MFFSCFPKTATKLEEAASRREKKIIFFLREECASTQVVKTKWNGNDLFYAALLNEKKKISCRTLVGVNKKGICLLVLPFFINAFPA